MYNYFIYSPGPEFLVALMLTSSMAFTLVKTNPGYICRSLAITALVAQTIASSSSTLSILFGITQISGQYIKKWISYCEMYQKRQQEQASMIIPSSSLQFPDSSEYSSGNESNLQTSFFLGNDEKEFRLSYFFAAMTYLGAAKIELANNAFEFYLEWVEKSGYGSDERLHNQRSIYMHMSLALYCNTSLMLETALIDCNYCSNRDENGTSAVESNIYVASFYAYSGDYDTSLIHYNQATRQVFCEQKVVVIPFILAYNINCI